MARRFANFESSSAQDEFEVDDAGEEDVFEDADDARPSGSGRSSSAATTELKRSLQVKFISVLWLTNRVLLP